MDRRVYRSLLTVEPLRPAQVIAAADATTRQIIKAQDFEAAVARIRDLAPKASLWATRAVWALLIFLALSAENNAAVAVYCAGAAMDESLGGAT